MSDRDTAFAEYFAARSGAMRGTAYLLCGDWHRAEDLVQTAFVKLYRVWNRISRHEVLDSYVRQILVPDGVVVYVAQGKKLDELRPELTKLPFSVPPLAALGWTSGST
ncbi:sigma factor [Micromonospora chokoriensis]